MERIMDKRVTKLTVFFEEPFWVGVFAQVSEGQLSVCKVTFGAEPKDYEVWECILKNYYKLKPSLAVKTELKKTAENPKRRQREAKLKKTAENPKRRQREAKKLLRNTDIGTKSQQALKMQREEMKTERKQISREQREAEKQRKFELRQQKRKEKHRGH